MSVSAAAIHRLFGLIELDHAGTVLYSRPEGATGRGAEADICGSNFYTEVAPFENVKEFRQRLAAFEATGSPADSFLFDCRFPDGEMVSVRVLLARMRQRANGGPAESLLVHIRKI